MYLVRKSVIPPFFSIIEAILDWISANIASILFTLSLLRRHPSLRQAEKREELLFFPSFHHRRNVIKLRVFSPPSRLREGGWSSEASTGWVNMCDINANALALMQWRYRLYLQRSPLDPIAIGTKLVDPPLCEKRMKRCFFLNLTWVPYKRFSLT
jgi:hypothetical protein